MRHFLKHFFSVSALVSIASAQLVLPRVVLDQQQDLSAVLEKQRQQQAMSQPDETVVKSWEPFVQGPMLSDVLSLEPQASIFFSYARESARLSGILSSTGEFGGPQTYTVFVPTNKAVMALARKPHLPEDSSVEISDEEADRQSQERVEKWVSAHIVLGTLEMSESSSGTHQTLLDGKSLDLSRASSNKSPEWSNWRLNTNVAIIGQRKAANGIMYLIEGTIEI